MKKITLLLFMLITVVGGVHAKQKTTILWEDTYSSAIELNAATVGTFTEGDVLRIYLTLTAENNFGISYKSAGNNWSDTAIPSVANMWPWISTTGDTYYDVTLTSDDITALSEQNIYIQKGEKSTITKVTLIHTLTPTATTNISTDAYNADWECKQYSGIETAKIGDVIKFSYTATGTYFQMYVMNYAKDETLQNDAYGVTNGESYTYEYIIPDYSTLKEIRTKGFAIKGADFSITSVDLLTYSDSYGYMTFTIGDTGYATWSSDKKYDFASAGLTAYYASAVAMGTVTMTSMDITWDWQGYIIRGEQGEYDVLESLTTDGTYYPSTNYLKQNINEGTVYRSVYSDYSGDAQGDELTNIKTKYRYIFSKSDSDTDGSTIGFYRLTGDHTLGANKAYLETTSDITPTGNARVNLDFGDESETTGIDNVDVNANENIDAPMYNLAGQRIGKSYKGIVIVNGKKYFNK